ncbi:microtubule associated protein-domain-containing protein [Helicostylum pulchrum]|nr:microtubule associated protein-domain-containing protein [Helicostylum pulchrum]
MTSMNEITAELELQLKRLSVVHDEIGYTNEAKQEKTANILESVILFVQEKVKNGVLEKEQIIKEAETTQKAILSYKKLMGEFASNKAVLDPSKSLLDNLKELQQEKMKVEQKYNQLLSHVKELYLQLEEFKAAMGDFVDTSMLMSKEVDVSSLAVNALEEEIQRCEIEYVNRKESVEDGVQQINNLLMVLGAQPTSQDELIYSYYHETDPNNKMDLCNQLVSQDNLRYMGSRIEQLEGTKQQLEARKSEITQNLRHLWNRLRVDNKKCEEFLMENRGFTQRELEQYEKELSRLTILKQERIGDFILTARDELKGLWKQLYYSENQMKQFKAAYVDELTEAVLEEHENEISRLQLETEDSKYILERIEKHMKLKNEVEDFEAITSDPNRLFGKGQRDPGRLLREEKFRKRISRELPKVTKELEGSLLEYEALKGHPFLVYGKSYFDVLYEQGLALEENKIVNNSRNLSLQDPLPTGPPRTPKRGIETRQPMTSPRVVKSVKRIFNTPQPARVKPFHFTEVASNKIDISASILHQVREKNIKQRKQKVIKRGHIFDDDDDDEDDGDEEDENTAPLLMKRNPRKRAHVIGSQSESDDALDLGIFDDGPDLSDMSDIDDA